MAGVVGEVKGGAVIVFLCAGDLSAQACIWDTHREKQLSDKSRKGYNLEWRS